MWKVVPLISGEAIVPRLILGYNVVWSIYGKDGNYIVAATFKTQAKAVLEAERLNGSLKR